MSRQWYGSVRSLMDGMKFEEQGGLMVGSFTMAFYPCLLMLWS